MKCIDSSRFNIDNGGGEKRAVAGVALCFQKYDQENEKNVVPKIPDPRLLQFS